MAMYLNTNYASMVAQNNLSSSQSNLATSIQRLSSGLRVNSAKDDAAGVAISEKMTAQIRGLNQGARNAADAISLSQTAEGALANITNNLQRMRELAVQASNFTSSNDITSIDAEYKALNAENTRIINAAKFNGTSLLSGALSATFQVGANSGETIAISSSAVTQTNSGTLGATTSTASAELAKLDVDIAAMSSTRATFGAAQSQFQAAISNIQNTATNLTTSRGRIVDADYAQETANLTKNQILQQAGTAMLAQANALPNTVLTLLK